MALDLRDAPKNLLKAEELQPWLSIPTAVISDDLNRTGAMVSGIKPAAPGMTFAGQALTIRAFVGDNAAPHYGLTKAWPGCIVVVDARGHTETAVWGGLLNYAAKARGAKGTADGALVERRARGRQPLRAALEHQPLMIEHAREFYCNLLQVQRGC